MATVTTPAGDVLEGVTGSLLDYYRGEGYAITDDEPEAQFPVTFDGEKYVSGVPASPVESDLAELDRADGVELSPCPDPDCDASVAAPATIVEHHDDGSHTMDWGQDVPDLNAVGPLDLH